MISLGYLASIKLTSQTDYTRKTLPIVIKTFSLLLYFSKEATQLAQKPHVRLFVFPSPKHPKFRKSFQNIVFTFG
jgi:hypothetical protein